MKHLKALRRHTDSRGQTIAIVIAIIVVLAIIVPFIVKVTQNEAKWTNKQSHNSQAFQNAEGGIERAAWALSQFSAGQLNWDLVMQGQQVADYHFDKDMTDIGSGDYAISITSGPLPQQATVISVGRDPLKQQTRAVKAVFFNAPLYNTALFSVRGTTVTGNVQAEWGSVASSLVVNASTGTCGGGACHPQYYSGGNVWPWNTSNTGVNCDSPSCVQWYGFSGNVPVAPYLNFEAYKSSAQTTGTYQSCSGGCPTLAASPANNTKGWTFYYDGSLTINGSIYIVGNLIVMGNLTYTCNAGGSGSASVRMPQTAWKQYGNDWNYYLTKYGTGGANCDPTAPATYSVVSSSHTSNLGCTVAVNNIDVQGLLYVGGNVTDNCDGAVNNRTLYGIMYVAGNTNITRTNGKVTLYYDPNLSQNLLVTQPVLINGGWKDVNVPWPSGL